MSSSAERVRLYRERQESITRLSERGFTHEANIYVMHNRQTHAVVILDRAGAVVWSGSRD